MFLIVHVLLGALIGIKYNSVLLVVVFAFACHFLLDVLPHWDSIFDNDYFKKNFVAKLHPLSVGIVVVDVLISVYLTWWLYGYFQSDLVLIGAVFSMLPDFLKLGYFTPLKKVGWYKKHLVWHAKIQRETGVAFGLFTQVVTAGLLVWALFF
jgi:hypothetical protein